MLNAIAVVVTEGGAGVVKDPADATMAAVISALCHAP